MHRVAILNGVNLDRLGARDPSVYGVGTLAELDRKLLGWGVELGLRVEPSQTNHEGEYVETLHRLAGNVAGVVLNPGAWTHYSWAIADAAADLGAPIVELHISDVDSREEWRRFSVLADVRAHRISGHGIDGYREALAWLAEQLAGQSSVD